MLYDSIRYDLVDNNYLQYDSRYDNREIDLEKDFIDLAASVSQSKHQGESYIMR